MIRITRPLTHKKEKDANICIIIIYKLLLPVSLKIEERGYFLRQFLRLRSLGIVPLFLPAYCPFFNPIEVFFGLVKQKMRKRYLENSKKDLVLVISEVMDEFLLFDLQPIFKHCGYSGSGFNPGVALEKDLQSLEFT